MKYQTLTRIIPNGKEQKLLNNLVYLIGDFGKVSELVGIAFGCM